MHLEVSVGRVYDEPTSGAARVLVDRVWPRGITKDDARLDEWAKDVAPSPQLRTWYAHDPARFAEFRRRYNTQLAEPERARALEQLRKLARRRPVVLLTASRDLEHSQAAVLAERLCEGD
jgi:uncharacterized protein YeaO (DUF488 family)